MDQWQQRREKRGVAADGAPLDPRWPSSVLRTVRLTSCAVRKQRGCSIWLGSERELVVLKTDDLVGVLA